jgi:hypothetical protein
VRPPALWAAGLWAVGAMLCACAQAAAADPGTVSPATIRSCIAAAAEAYHEPPAVLLILLNVEGGTLGSVSQNTNDTVDIGPMQVNQIWIPGLAAHWSATPRATYLALRDDFCANVEAGAWILRRGLDEANGDFWEGVAFYHSHDPVHKRTYLRSVLDQALHLKAEAEQAVRPAAPRPSRQPASSMQVAGK